MPCTRIATDLDLFNRLAAGPQTAEELAQASGADKALIGTWSTCRNESSLMPTSADNACSRGGRRGNTSWSREIWPYWDRQRLLSSIHQCPYQDRVRRTKIETRTRGLLTLSGSIWHIDLWASYQSICGIPRFAIQRTTWTALINLLSTQS